MPFKSKAQMKYAFATAKEPGRGFTKKQAKEWAEKTKSKKALPEKAKKGTKRGRR